MHQICNHINVKCKVFSVPAWKGYLNNAPEKKKFNRIRETKEKHAIIIRSYRTAWTVKSTKYTARNNEDKPLKEKRVPYFEGFPEFFWSFRLIVIEKVRKVSERSDFSE